MRYIDKFHHHFTETDTARAWQFECTDRLLFPQIWDRTWQNLTELESNWRGDLER
jgi:hypothetical protein